MYSETESGTIDFDLIFKKPIMFHGVKLVPKIKNFITFRKIILVRTHLII